MPVPLLGPEGKQGSFWLLVSGVSSVQCYCWDDSFFLPVGFIHWGYAVSYAGVQQRSVWNSQTLGKVFAGTCRSTFWALVCRDWVLCWRWVPVTAAHWGAAQTCITTYAGGTSGIAYYTPAWWRPGKTQYQLRFLRICPPKCCNLPNPEHLCEAAWAKVQSAASRTDHPPWHGTGQRSVSTESSSVFLSTRKVSTTQSESRGGVTRVGLERVM